MFKRAQAEGSSRPRRRWFTRRRIIVAVVILAVAGGIYSRYGKSASGPSTATTFAAKRGPLDITVVEGGGVEAIESQTIKSEIKGQTKILTIVDEGYLVTEEDVKNKKVLVTLDDSELLERMTQEEFEYQSALANYTDAREQYEIQLKQNESDITAAELEVRFALMDFEKYLGAELARTIVKERDIDLEAVMRQIDEESKRIDEAAAADKNKSKASEDAGGDVAGEAPKAEDAKAEEGDKPQDENPAPAKEEKKQEPQPEKVVASTAIKSNLPRVDFTQYADPERLGDGEAQQTLRKLQSERILSEQELGLAETKLTGTRRLAEKNFVTKQDLDNDEMTVKKSTVAKDSAMTAEELFIKYEFPKQGEKLLSAYEEAIRKFERTKRQAVAKEAQAVARKNSSEASFKLRERRRKELQEQLDACTIVAERPGLVVYAGSDEPWRRQDPIEAGANVNEFQEIITIPDMTQMAVKVKVHESAIKQIQKGQKATIKLDAYPDEELHGEVTKISVLPDSGQRWMNPDIKLYPCTVSIQGTFEWLKPSMTAQVEIMVKQLPDVIYVPIQAVFPEEGKRVCHVVDTFGGTQSRVVETGEMNKDFIEIKSGLKEGERVMLRAPQTGTTAGKDDSEKSQDKREKPEGEAVKQEGERREKAEGDKGKQEGERRERPARNRDQAPAAPKPQ
ncbi:MAG: HlyD family efflux transporter periplasmic adaptor subunit [Candidatus Hydrogenedentes bacterium]|nr:HlyD family efflux transporter periplasmic adaptor subunit [Candidatus Hydrogenedentota bacterium]